jgi:cytochrome P450
VDLASVQDVFAAEEPVAISVDGKKAREVPGPKGLPYFGVFFEVYPDHLGNHQRLFDMYGPMFKTTAMGRTIYHTNDPALASIVFAESDFFSKVINEDHPLYPIRNKEAGVFLGDTNTEEWRIVHKFLPPAFGPKAVRHYAPTMQKTVEDAFNVFDELDERNQAWNVYPYMLKLGSQAVGKLVLGFDFNHFTSVDARPHELVMLIAESLELNKKVSSRGDWYAALPFGDPKRLRDMKERIRTLMEEPIQKAKRGGIHDLDLQDAALTAENMIGMLLISLLPPPAP